MLIETTKADVTSWKEIYRITQPVQQGKMKATLLCQDVLIINETLITELGENVDLLLFDKTSTCCFIFADMLNA
jgi:hypothetical protein